MQANKREIFLSNGSFKDEIEIKTTCGIQYLYTGSFYTIKLLTHL